MNEKICKNCGAHWGLHMSGSNQCPRNGIEHQDPRKQKWESTVFEEDEPDEIAELKAQVKTLQAQVKALLDAVPSAKVNA